VKDWEYSALLSGQISPLTQSRHVLVVLGLEASKLQHLKSARVIHKWIVYTTLKPQMRLFPENGLIVVQSLGAEQVLVAIYGL
jgi:hypothetical protein